MLFKILKMEKTVLIRREGKIDKSAEFLEFDVKLFIESQKKKMCFDKNRIFVQISYEKVSISKNYPINIFNAFNTFKIQYI